MEVEYPLLFKMTVFSHFFRINVYGPRAIQLCLQFCHKFVLMGYVKDQRGRTQYRPIKVFATRVKDNTEFRFHIGQKELFMKFLDENYITPDMYAVDAKPIHVPKLLRSRLQPHWVLKDYQEDVDGFIREENSDDNRSRLVCLRTGAGKTLTALASVSRIGHRSVILILPKYMEKWGEDITKTLDTKPKEIMMIQGSGQLKGLIGMAKDGNLTSDFIVISLNTIQNFFKKYEEHPQDSIDEYGCHPETLFELLEVGNMIIDEVHEHLHEVFKLLMYTHLPLLIALSATFISDDPKIQQIQHLMFPREIRFENVVNDPYIKVYALYYAFKDIQKARIRTTEFGSTNYSHNAFEKSIIRNRATLAGYLDLIHYLVDLAYVRDYKTGDRLIIFASSIDMCTTIVNYLKTFYKEYDIRRYVENDPYENVIEADIRVTTPQSAGTAIDIPNLRATIMTINISSSKTNLQTLGRLRKLPDRDVKFYYIFCEQLKKHYEYHNKRMELFADRVLSIKELRSPVMV